MKTFFKFILVLLILGSGGLVAKKLIDTKPSAKRKPVSIGAPLVTVITAVPVYEQVKITAMGTVIPAREVVIQPRVSGHVAEMNPELIPGGYFSAGDILLRIDDQDYAIAVSQRKADVARAVMDLKTEESRQAIARKEWDILGSAIPATDKERDMALRKPQLKNATAALAPARSLLKKARLDVERPSMRSSKTSPWIWDNTSQSDQGLPRWWARMNSGCGFPYLSAACPRFRFPESTPQRVPRPEPFRKLVFQEN